MKLERINTSMRDIIDTLLLLNESTGLAGRKPGDVFKDSNGDEIIFNEISIYPEKGGRLDKQQLDHLLLDVNGEAESPIIWTNNRNGRTGGFAVASFSGSNGEVLYGRYLENVRATKTDNFFPNQVGDYKLASKNAAKSQAALSPQDLLTNKIDLDPDQILVQLAKSLGTDSPLYKVAYQLSNGEPLPIKFKVPEGISFSAFRDYFCEILQPIALQRGQFTGNAGEAAEIFLGGSFDDTLISFDDSKTAGLSDCVMTTSDGRHIKVSSKGGKGATASAKNLINSVIELEKSPSGKKLLKKYKGIIEELKEIQRKGQYNAPLYLAVKYDIINETEADKIRQLKDTPEIDMDNIKKYKLTPNLIKLANTKKPKIPDKVNLYYHLMACVAAKAAEKVNEHTNFSKAAADILNNGALIQVYTKAKEGKDEWTLSEFNTVFPGDNIKGVYLSAEKTYYSTGIKGNYTFKIDKGEGVPKSNSEEIPRSKRSATKSEFVDKAKDIALGKNNKKDSKPKDISVGNVGRKLRKV